MTKRIYRSMQGREVDMDALMSKHEMMPAVGNARMNARGDELGPGGKVVRRREDIVAEYYEDNPNAAPRETPVPAKPAAKPSIQKPSHLQKPEVKKSV